MRTFYVNGVLTVQMAHEEFVNLMKAAEAEGVRAQLETAQSFPPTMAKNGTRTTSKKKSARKVVARRKTARHNTRRAARPALRNKRRTGKQRDWSAIVAKRLATQAANREARRAEQAQASAEAI